VVVEWHEVLRLYFVLKRRHNLRLDIRIRKRRRHDADDRVRLAIQEDVSTDDRQVPAEAPLPQTPGDHDSGVSLRTIVRRIEAPSIRGPHTERREELC
jgi:hypothetical protein